MITQKDLIEGIKGFPIEVVEKMLDRQKEQGNKENVQIFQRNKSASDNIGGFTWSESPEGHDFWHSVINNRNFDTFFSKYPKRKNTIISINKSTKVKLNFNL